MGKKSKQVGNKFQEDFAGSVPYNILVERYKDSPVRFKKVTNPADFWINSGYFVLLVECKTTNDTCLPLANIRMDQVWKMLCHTTKFRTFGGFAINFRRYNQTYFVFIEDFIHWYMTNRSSSLSFEWIRRHGYKVSQQIKVSRWRYGVQGLLDWVKAVKLDGI